MYRRHRIAVVIPAHNEARHIGSVVTTLPAFVDHAIVVDDASTDGTSDVVSALGDPRVALLRHEGNEGVGGAVVSGFARALQMDADLVAVMGGDGQMDPGHLGRLLDQVIDGRCEVAKGNRFAGRGSLRGMPMNRRIGNWLLSWATKVASGYWRVFDSQNGYIATSRTTLERLPLDRLRTGYQFENVLLIELAILGVRVQDVGIPARYGEEISGIRVSRVGPAILWALVKGFFRRLGARARRRPRSRQGEMSAASASDIASVE